MRQNPYDQGTGPLVRLRNGSNLDASRGESGEYMLVAVGPYRFERLDLKAELQFLLHDGKVTGYISKVGQQEFRGERVK